LAIQQKAPEDQNNWWSFWSKLYSAYEYYQGIQNRYFVLLIVLCSQALLFMSRRDSI